MWHPMRKRRIMQDCGKKSKAKIKNKSAPLRLCNFSGENTNTAKEISLVVFLSLGSYERLPPGGSWRRKATEGERVIMRSI